MKFGPTYTYTAGMLFSREIQNSEEFLILNISIVCFSPYDRSSWSAFLNLSGASDMLCRLHLCSVHKSKIANYEYTH